MHRSSHKTNIFLFIFAKVLRTKNELITELRKNEQAKKKARIKRAFC